MKKRRPTDARMTLLVAATFAVALVSLPAPAGPIQSTASIAQAARAYVLEATPRSAGKLIVEPAELDSRLRLDACAQPLQAEWALGAAPRARTTVAVACPDKGGWRVNVPVSISAEIDALVLRAPASRGSVLGKNDLEQRRMTVDGPGYFYITELSQLEGRRLARGVPAGRPIAATVLAPEVVIERGQAVTLLALVNGIEIRAAGRALADAGASDRVRVQNLSSLKVVEGVAESGSVVRVSP